jgi:hypothetical protein
MARVVVGAGGSIMAMTAAEFDRQGFQDFV